MLQAATTSAHLAHPRRDRLLVVTLAAALVTACAGAVSSTGLGDPDPQNGPAAWPSAPIGFGDPAVVKGARGGATARVRLQDPASAPMFGDPTVRKGAGGR